MPVNRQLGDTLILAPSARPYRDPTELGTGLHCDYGWPRGGKIWRKWETYRKTISTSRYSVKVTGLGSQPSDTYLIHRIGWLRAAVLGANDGIISTASLVVGATAGSHSTSEVLLAGVAALVAGATAMAAGEYVSVHSLADMEMADIAREKRELVEKPKFELDELTRIYIDRGVEPALARQVSQQMMAHDALGTHVRDELGFSEPTMARPIQAAIASAATFACGAALPLIAALLASTGYIAPMVSRTSLVGLAALGTLGARAGRANILGAAIRVTFWGAFAMAATAIIGALVGQAV